MLSVIVPAYNEELSIEKAYYTISGILNTAVIDNEIILPTIPTTLSKYPNNLNINILITTTHTAATTASLYLLFLKNILDNPPFDFTLWL